MKKVDVRTLILIYGSFEISVEPLYVEEYILKKCSNVNGLTIQYRVEFDYTWS